MKNKKIALVAMFTVIVIFIMFLNNNIYASYEVTSTTFHRSDGRCVCDYCGATFTNSTLEKCPGCGLKFKPDSTTFHRSDGRCVCDFCGTTFTNSLSTSCPGCGVSFSNTSSSETNSNNASASNNNRNGNGISGAGVPTNTPAYDQVYGGGTAIVTADNQNSNGASGSGGSGYTQGQSGSAGTTPTTSYSQNSNGTISNSGSSTATPGTISNNSNGSSETGTTSTTSSSGGTIRTSSVNRSSSSSGSNGDSGTYSSKLDADDFNTSPSIDSSGKAMNLVKKILGVINVVGTIVLFVTIALLGIKYISGSLEERADYKKSMIPILVGAFLLFSTSTIINIVYSIMNN